MDGRNAMRLKRAIIFAKNIERMTAFYRDGLGLRVLPRTSIEGWVELDAGGSLLALHAIPAEIARGIRIASPQQARADAPVKLVFQTSDVEAARVHLIAHGAVMHETQSWGACDGLDPEGNVFQIVRI
jgi:catechol-2,3-dioxygenase